MRSMTGYGRGVATVGGARSTVEIRSVNHRFLDLKLRGSPVPPSVEEAISTRVRKTLERGAVVVSVQVSRASGPASTRIDHDAAGRIHAQLVEAASRLGLPGPDLALVLAQPGVVVPASRDDDDDERGEDPAIIAALDTAIGELERMRGVEGAVLATELGTRLEQLAALRTSIATLAATTSQQLAKKLAERTKKLLDDVATIDPARLAQEIALLADRADVTEELVRLVSHLDQARGMIASTAPVGRKLDFLVQELGRELNTIGSKSASAEITSLVVEGKAVLEKIREQVQNVE